MSPRPVVGSVAEELYEAVEPLAFEDEQLEWPLLTYLGALGEMFQLVADLARDTDERPGWTAVVDLDATPADWLPWLAQLAGVILTPGLDEDSQRLRIRETDGQKRGSPGAVRGAARQHLIGPDGTGETATVFLVERHGSAYRMTVATLESETPDSARVLASLIEQKPGGIVLSYQVIVGGDYESLRETHSDYADVLATFTDYADILSNPTKQ